MNKKKNKRRLSNETLKRGLLLFCFYKVLKIILMHVIFILVKLKLQNFHQKSSNINY